MSMSHLLVSKIMIAALICGAMYFGFNTTAGWLTFAFIMLVFQESYQHYNRE